MGQLGGLVRTPKKESSAPFVSGSANNGLSVDAVSGKIVIGNDVGDPLNPGALLTSRQILFPPGATIQFTDAAGDVVIFNPVSISIADASGNNGAFMGLGQFQSFMQNGGAFNPNYQLFKTGIVGVGATLDIDNASIVSVLRITNGNPVLGFFFDTTNNRLAIGNVTVPTARLHLSAGTAAVSGAPFKYTAGVLNQTVVENGTKNFDGTNESIAAGGVTYILAKTLTATGALAFPLTAAQSSSDLTIPVVGAALGDVVSLGVPNASVLANSCYTAFVSAAGVVTVRFNNYSAAGQTPGAGTFRISVTKY